jgi:hypothetical protein
VVNKYSSLKKIMLGPVVAIKKLTYLANINSLKRGRRRHLARKSKILPAPRYAAASMCNLRYQAEPREIAFKAHEINN